jgi:hypothetical protein
MNQIEQLALGLTTMIQPREQNPPPLLSRKPGHQWSAWVAKCILGQSFIITGLTIGSLALAAGQEKSTAAKGSAKRTSINFEDQLVEGQTQKPELFYLLQQKNNNFKRLIRLRENFIPEMRKTSEDVGRTSGKGSGD